MLDRRIVEYLHDYICMIIHDALDHALEGKWQIAAHELEHAGSVIALLKQLR